MAKTARRFLVSGIVQGIGFRDFARQAAKRSGVVGYVRNLSDGRVEIVCEGPEAPMAAFREDLGRGPPFSQVDAVDAVAIELTGGFTTFDVR